MESASRGCGHKSNCRQVTNIQLGVELLECRRLLSGSPRNVILMIGDGMGSEQVEAGRYLLDPNGTTPLSFETFAYQAEVITASADSAVTDSAAAATAMATGQKVNNGVISQATPGDGADLQTSLELYQELGRMTGLVTTTYMTHATPAAFGAHEPNRDNVNEIATDYLGQSKPNILFGGGSNGMSPADAAAAGYTVVTTASEMQNLDTNNETYVSGQFGNDHLPYEYDGLGDLPGLSDMTATALDILDNDPDGFFLMVEGGRIDHAGHDNDFARMQQEVVEFSDTVQVVIDWVDTNSGWGETLVVVTADHETGGLSYEPGGSPEVSWSTTGHTGINVPIYARGANAHTVSGTWDNSEVFALTMTLSTVDPFEIVMLPDTQHYSTSAGGAAIFNSQTQWIADNVIGDQLAFVSHVGDIVQNGAANEVEWTRADTAMDLLDGAIPYSAIAGNHDFDTVHDHSSAVKYIQYFGPTRYTGQTWYGGSSADQTSHYQIFTAGGWDFLHVGLEWNPRPQAITWAQSVIDAHDNLPVILSTHNYLGTSNRTSSGTAIFNSLVTINPQIFMVLCGHVGGENKQVVQNDAGLDVIEILADYQARDNGGDGWLRLINFLPDQDLIEFQTYSPYREQNSQYPFYETDADSQFTIPLNFDERFNFAPTASLLAPLDNGPEDLDLAVHTVTVNSTQTVFQIQLDDVNDAVNDATVTSSTVAVSKNQVLLVEPDDYTFSYDAGGDLITLAPVGGTFGNGDYQISLNGIADVAGNVMLPTTLGVLIDTSIQPPQTVVYQQGVAGYTDTVDTFLQESSANANNASATSLNVDADDPADSGLEVHALMRFDMIFGSGADRIPADSEILSATLDLQVTNAGSSVQLHRMLQTWLETDTWNSLGTGVQADGIEANVTADVTTGAVGTGALSIDVTNSLAAWSANPADNFGWVLLPTGSDGVDFNSSEGTTAPKLSVTFVPRSSGSVPTAVNDSYTLDEDSVTETLNVTANDDFGDDGPASAAIVIVGAPGHGSAVVNDGGTVTQIDDVIEYTPDSNYNGLDQLVYQISDSTGDLSTATVDITVTAVNDLPLAGHDSYTRVEDSGSTALDATANDDFGGDGPATTAILIVTAPSHGTAIVNDGGTPANPIDDTIEFTPNGDYHGTDQLTYQISDSDGDVSTANVTITITPVADVVDDVAYTSQDTLLDIDVLANDGFVGPASVTLVTNGTHGTTAINADGTVRYTPNPSYLGPDSFTYSATEDDGTIEVGAVDVTVTVAGPQLGTGVVSNVNNINWTMVTLSGSYVNMVVVTTPNYDNTQVPLVTRIRNAVGNSFEIQVQRADGLTTDIGNGIDVHYMVVEAGVYTQAEHGVTMEARTYLSTVTDAKGAWIGESQSLTNSYTAPVVLGQVMSANDPRFSVFWDRGISRTAPPTTTQLYVGKTVLEDPDTARADETVGYVVIESGIGTINGVSYSAALGSDSIQGVGDLPPYSYSLSGVTNVEVAIASQAAMDDNSGSWPLLYGSNPVSDTTLQLAVDEDQIKDAERNHMTEQVAYIVFEAVANTPPVAASDGYSVDEDQTLNVAAPGVLTNDSDADSDPLSAVLVSGPANGELNLLSDGAFTYTPNLDFNGSDSFAYQANDGTVDSNVATVNITVDPVNDAPVLTSIGNQHVDEESSLSFTATATDIDLPADNLTFGLEPGAPVGASIDPVTGLFTWTPDEADGPGNYSVMISVTDDGTPNLSVSETITITVNEVNSAPVLVPIGAQSVDEQATLTFSALANDPDVPANGLTFTLDVAALALGMSITSGGDFFWAPTEAQGGSSYNATITVTDDGSPSLSDAETITIIVNKVNNAPVLEPIGDKTTAEEQLLTFVVTASDAGDDPVNNVTLSAAGLPAGATFDTLTGQFSWTPNETQQGTHTNITFTATDDGTPNLSASEAITITVNEVNLAPVLVPIGAQSVDEQATLTFSALANDSDVPVNGLTFTIDAAALALGMSITSGGDFSWTPTEAQGGSSYNATITVTDDGSPSLSDAETITITVNEVNNAPVLDPIGDKTVDEGSLLTFTATAFDTDLPANSLTFSLGAGAPTGASIDPVTGLFTWTPALGDGPGSYPLDVVVTDDGTPQLSDSETIIITVNVSSTPSDVLYFAVDAAASLGGLSVASEDILALDEASTFRTIFDGSDVGLGGFRINSFAVVSETVLLFSFAGDHAIPGIADTVEDSDIVQFTAVTLGEETSGSFSLYFDGSDVALTTNGEDVDAVELLSDGRLLISTGGSWNVSGLSGKGEDMLAFTPTSLGNDTAGNWNIHFDGSDVGLSTGGENLDAVGLDDAGGIYLSTRGGFRVTGISGAGEDVFVFHPATLGETTSGQFDSSMFFDGSVYGLDVNNLGAIDIPTSGQNLAAAPTGEMLRVAAAAPADAMVARSLAEAPLRPLINQAIAYWAAQGVSTERFELMDHVKVGFSDLAGPVLGVATSSHMIWIDRDAAGYGWHAPAHQSDRAVIGVDLLSVLTHEFGHALGFDHDVMSETLCPGIRSVGLANSPLPTGLAYHGVKTNTLALDDHFTTWRNTDTDRCHTTAESHKWQCSVVDDMSDTAIQTVARHFQNTAWGRSSEPRGSGVYRTVEDENSSLDAVFAELAKTDGALAT